MDILDHMSHASDVFSHTAQLKRLYKYTAAFFFSLLSEIMVPLTLMAYGSTRN